MGVPGDREVDLKRLAGQLEPVEVAVAEPDDLAKVPGLVKGYIGPQLLAELKVRYLVDPLVVEGRLGDRGQSGRQARRVRGARPGLHAGRRGRRGGDPRR